MFNFFRKKTEEEKFNEWIDRRKKWLMNNGWTKEQADRIVSVWGREGKSNE